MSLTRLDANCVDMCTDYKNHKQSSKCELRRDWYRQPIGANMCVKREERERDRERERERERERGGTRAEKENIVVLPRPASAAMKALRRLYEGSTKAP